MFLNFSHIRLVKKSHFRWDFFVCLLILFCILVHPVFPRSIENASLRGTVVDAETGLPLKDVNIVLVGTTKGTTTDEIGEFHLAGIPEGEQTVEFSYVGYVKMKITRRFYQGIEIQLLVQLLPHHVRLEEIEIIGETGVRDVPRRAPDSDIITSSQIIDSGIGTFSELIRHLIPRATVSEDGPDLYISLMRATSMVRRYHGDNNPLIIIDGFNYGNSPTGLNSIVSVDQIEKLEVIRGPGALRYGPEGRHGVIIIDTKQQLPIEDGVPTTIKMLVALALGILIVIVF